MNQNRTETDLVERHLPHLEELRRLAAAGQRVPLLGGPVYLAWGFTIMLAASAHLIMMLAGTTMTALVALWSIALASCAAVVFIMLRRVDEDRRASIERNQASGLLWAIGGSGTLLFYVASFLHHPEAVALTPAVAAYIFAVVIAAASIAAPIPLARVQMVGWLAFGTIYLLLDDARLKIGSLVIAAVLLLILPGMALRRTERASDQ